MSIAKIEELTRELVNKIEQLATKENLEAIAAKIIKEILEKLESQEPILEKPEEIRPKGSPKYSFPNFNVGNESLGSSKNPNALKWPFGSTSND